jgi:TusA-related sulfurtransferase
MTLKIRHRKADEVPEPSSGGRVNEDFNQVKTALSTLTPGDVLEIETQDPTAVRGTKSMVTRAGKQLGRSFVHWNTGTKVFVKPASRIRRDRARGSAAASREVGARRG